MACRGARVRYWAGMSLEEAWMVEVCRVSKCGAEEVARRMGG